MIDFTPNPVAFAIGPLEVRWYGIAYVAMIAAGAWLAYSLAKRRGERTDILADGLILVAIAALVGGRAYHVIDQWAYYQDHLAQIVLPPYSGLGIYGGLATGLVAVVWYVRRHHVSFWRWADIIGPSVLLAQAIGRWGNFMNQELYGPPTNLPWGIAIQCQHRVPEYLCPVNGGTTPADAHFVPLFFYESMMSLIGVAVMLFLWSRFTSRGRLLIAGDVGLLYFTWYGIERSLLETFRSGYNWTFFGIPTAQVIGVAVAIGGIVAILVRHWWVRGHPEDAGASVQPVPDEQPEAAAA
jgi:phosphatidylglycerol:prolipoprotein diacylglycerol transferase